MKLFTLFVLLSALLVASASAMKKSPYMPCKGQARYNITFIYRWTPQRFPMNFPPLEDAIFSPLTGASHNRRISAWTNYGYASPGVEQIAETGMNKILAEALTGVPLIKEVIAADGPAPYDGSHSVMATLDPKFTQLSFLTMIFPSPDWFTGIENKNMCTKRGTWKNKSVGLLYPWDAGTDSGKTYLAEDVDTQPRENIAILKEAPLFGKPLGYYIIRRVGAY